MFLSFLLILACVPSALLDFAIPKWKADKDVRIEDAYKWLYQATRGGEHAVADDASAHKWLDEEWAGLGAPDPGEPTWEPLCTGGDIGRLNLRPFRDSGGNKDDLVTAFLRSSRVYQPGPSEFLAAWNALGERLRKQTFGNLTRNSWFELDRKAKANNYPAIHHSSSYETTRHPAYRVLTGAEMTKLLKEH